MKCFRMRGKKGEEHFDLTDPPRRRANKQRGHGTYENDRPPVVGTVGRETGQVRLRVVHQTTQETLEAHVHQFTVAGATCYTDEWKGYDHLIRAHATVSHGQKEWARDDDGDGKREVHINTSEGMWTDVRTFLRPFKGVNKRFLSGYIAMAEFRRNLKRISPAFIAMLVAAHF
jgi:transposase